MGYDLSEIVLPKGWENWCRKKEMDRYKEVRKSDRNGHFMQGCRLQYLLETPLDKRTVDPHWIKFLDKRMREKNEELDTLKELGKENVYGIVDTRFRINEFLREKNREDGQDYPYAWSTFLNDQKVEKLVELHSLRKLKKVSHGTTENWLARGRIASIELKKCKEDYEEIEKGWEEKRFDPWVLVTNERVLKNEELFALKELKCVSRLRSSRSFSDNIGSIETKKCQQHLNHIYQHFKRNEIRREAVKKLTRGRNTTGYYKSNDSEILERHPDNCFPSFSFNKHSQHPIRPGFTFGY